MGLINIVGGGIWGAVKAALPIAIGILGLAAYMAYNLAGNF